MGDRSVFSSFVLYLPRFFLYWTGISPLLLFLKRGEYGQARDMAYGMFYYYSMGVLLCLCTDWKFAAGYWLYPFLESLSLLGMIAYIWHAFVDASDPNNQYINSITILDGGDNVWNEDYHVVHHHAPHVHWTDAPAHFESNKDKYAEVTATIFRDCEEGLIIQWMFSGDWDALAEHFVDLNGTLSHEEKKELILRRLRTRHIEGSLPETLGASWKCWGNSAQRY